jgi:hypothetical protein
LVTQPTAGLFIFFELSAFFAFIGTAGVHFLLGALGGGRLAGRLIGSRASLLSEGGGGNGSADGCGHQDRKDTHV